MGDIRGRAIVLAGTVCLLFYVSEIGIGTTVLLLVAVITGLLGELPDSISSDGLPELQDFFSRYFSRVCTFLYALFFLSGLFYAPALVMAPFIVYDAVRPGHRPALPFMCPAVLWRIHEGDVALTAAVVFLALVAAEFSLVLAENATLKEKSQKQRDDSVEHDILAGQRARELMEQQDANIYAATLKERNRIAREIHDNVGHMLTRSILQTGAIAVLNESEALKEPLAKLQETLNSAMDSMRNSVHDLHDESVDLKAAIEKIAEDMDDFGLELDYDMGRTVPRDVKYAFIAITKEAVNNAVKYSGGTLVSVVLREHPAFYQLMILDNGRGVHGHNEGIGLQNMRERVAALGGTIKITEDDGFRILVTVFKK